MGTLLCFSENCSVIVNKTYWALKKEEIINLTIIVLCSFL